ncbi:methyl-accepting chemotaxis protein [Halovenus salina]|uniref:Methyl-accepting chemotaxis protein n=2 Tax=Halovenus salina TaxID=1510225 RepID=A0ABD5W2R7_9EURY
MISDNLLAKFVVGILLIVFLIGAIALFFQTSIADELDSQVSTQVEETAGLHADIYTAWQGNRFSHLAGVAGDEGLDVDNERVRSDLLTRGRDDSEYFAQIHLVDRESGEVLASSAEQAVGENLFERVNETLVTESSEFIAPSRYTSPTGETVVGFGRQRLLEPSHVLIGEVPADGGPAFGQTIANSRTIIANQDGEAVFGQEDVDPAVVQREGSSSGNATVTQTGGEIHGSQPIGDTGLTVVTSSPEGEAFAIRDSVIESFVIMLALAFGVLIVVGVVGGRSITNSITALNDRATEMENGNLSVEFETARTDEIGELYAGFASMRDSLRERITEAEEALSEANDARERAEGAREQAANAREEAETINEQIEASADSYSDVMRKAANGNLTVRMEPDNDNEAMAAIARDFNAMLKEFEATIQEITTFATEVATESEDVTNSSEEIRVASEDVSQAIQEISDGAMEQSDELQAVTAEMNDLSATIEEIAASSDQVASVAEETAETGRKGREDAQAAIDGMETIRAESQRAVEEIAQLEDQVQQVDDLIARMADIAEQTSILALNANIEAARASGDGGDGFGVVANEVKALSEDAKEAADEVERRLESIRGQTQESAEAVQTASGHVDEHTESVENAAAAFSEVAEYAAETSDGIAEISAAADEQATSTERVVAMVDEVASIAERTTTQAENTAATAEQQAASMSSVSKNVTDLAEQAAQLSETLEGFETN